MAKSKPTKPELAEIKVMSELGLSPNAIGKKIGKDPKTVRKYLNSDVYNYPDVRQLVSRIKEKELADLILLGAKGRIRLHEHLDGGKMRPIEVIAAIDRVFQQRRLLEGSSTENVSHRGLVEHIQAEVFKLDRRLEQLNDTP